MHSISLVQEITVTCNVIVSSINHILLGSSTYNVNV